MYVYNVNVIIYKFSTIKIPYLQVILDIVSEAYLLLESDLQSL